MNSAESSCVDPGKIRLSFDQLDVFLGVLLSGQPMKQAEKIGVFQVRKV